MTAPATEIPGVTLRPFAPGAGPVTVAVEPAREVPAEQRAKIDAAWSELRRENPDLHDGPILAVESASPSTGRIACRRSSFRHLAVASRLGLDLMLLGVRGVVTARVRTGDECVLLGRRSTRTRVYGGLWENAPAGGMQVPPAGVSTLGEDDLIRGLADEGLEEVGLDIAAAADVRSVALLADHGAHSEDVLIHAHVRETISPVLPCLERDGPGAWEYIDAAWVPTAGLDEFDRRHGPSISPPARAVFRYFGWVFGAEG